MMLVVECEGCGNVLEIEERVTVRREGELGRFIIEGVVGACPLCQEWRWHLCGEAEEEEGAL